MQPTYRDLVELSRICRGRARKAEDGAVAEELRKLAKEYRQRAAVLSGGEKLDPEEHD